MEQLRQHFLFIPQWYRNGKAQDSSYFIACPLNQTMLHSSTPPVVTEKGSKTMGLKPSEKI
jgi:hypothetical protein